VLQFAAPIWLSVPAAAALAGAWALWRGQRRRQMVSSLRLWKGLATEGAAKRRRLDPLWLLVLLAALLAGLALAQPRWTRGTPSNPPLDVTWNVRTLHADTDTTEAWIRSPQLPAPPTLTINGADRPVTPDQLRRGLALPVTPDPHGTITLTLQAGSARAAATFADPGTSPPFGLLEITASGMSIDPALSRVFHVQKNPRPGDPSIQPRVVLLNDAHPRPEDLQDADLVIAQPATPLPGLVPGARSEGQWTPQVNADSGFNWPAFVALKHVQVTARRAVTLSPDWRTLATVDGKPWIAYRTINSESTNENSAMYIWLASDPATETNWVNNSGFVLFFAELQQRALATAPQRLGEWAKLPETVNAAAISPVPLDVYVGAAAIALLAAAVLWFLARSQS
jgi:hypothetical protein